jgi:hypothetical protein
MAKHACGIAKAEVIEDLPVNTRQRRSRRLLSDDWEWRGPIEHPMERNALKPAYRRFSMRMRLWVGFNKSRDLTRPHHFYRGAFNHSRSRIA